MKRFVCTLITVFTFITTCVDTSTQRVLKPYDPEKAGATIVKSFDITGKIILFGITGYPVNSLKDAYYNVAEYNDAIYIKSGNIINVFDKQNFNKKDEIILNKWFSKRSYGFVITADKNALLQTGSNNLFFLYLASGEWIRIDDFEIEDGFNFKDTGIWEMGCNMADNSIWFPITQNHVQYYYFFYYDEGEGFTFLERKRRTYMAYC